MAGPLWLAFTAGVVEAYSFTPTSMRLIHGLPLILTTVEIVGFSCAFRAPTEAASNTAAMAALTGLIFIRVST